MGLIGGVSAMVLMTKVGRRAKYLWGSIVLILLYVCIGVASILPENNASRWAIPVLLLIWTLVSDLTTGPVC